jgi:hypothetical protein
MVRQSRRKFIVGGISAITIGLAGCSSSSGDAGDGGSENEWQEIGNSRERVEEDGFISWSWQIDDPAEIRWEMTVRSGPSVEFFVMESVEFDEYQAGNRFRTTVQGSGTSDIGTRRIEEGNYRFVIDNTDAGSVQPPTNLDDDVAEVELEIEARSV